MIYADCIEVINSVLISVAVVFFLVFAIHLIIEMIRSLKYEFILPLVSKRKSTKIIIIKQGEKSKKSINKKQTNKSKKGCGLK